MSLLIDGTEGNENTSPVCRGRLLYLSLEIENKQSLNITNFLQAKDR